MILASLLAASMYGQFMSGNSLLEICRNLNNGYPSGECRAYISGAIDASTLDALAQKRTMSYCLQEGMSTRQLRDIIVLYMEGNPGIRHHGGALMIHNALVEAFPCKNP